MNITKSPVDVSVETDNEMLAFSGFEHMRTEIDLLILRNLDCSVDESGDENIEYWDSLNL